MDFAGGTAVHITSGTTAAAIAVFYKFETKGLRHCWGQLLDMLGERVTLILYCFGFRRKDNSGTRQGAEEHEMSTDPSDRVLNGDIVTVRAQDPETVADTPISPSEPDDEGPHNINNVVIGTALLWIGWFGFNGGSALGGNLRAVSACASTHVSACAGGSANLLIFWLLNVLARKFPKRGHDPNTDQKHSIILFCDGVVIALVAITPAAGYVRLPRRLTSRDFANRARFLFGAPPS
jgi:ammonia channel protein AmtB